ncbi:MAG TPA: hypothetical protein VGM30_25140 [Puia sp.]|jgi:hypothetical protein
MSFVVWGAGLLLGLILSAIIKKPRWEPYLYFSGQLAILLTVCGFFLSIWYGQLRHEKLYGNIEDNRSFVGIRHAYDGYYVDSSDHDAHLRTAFYKLESMFPDSNSYRLTNSYSHGKDTLINGDNKVVHIIYFTYRVDKKEFFSKISVIDTTAVINIFNRETRSSAEYQKMNREADRFSKETLESDKKVIDSLPDSARQVIIHAMPELK